MTSPPTDSARSLTGSTGGGTNKQEHTPLLVRGLSENTTPRLVLSIAEVAKAIGVSISSVERLIRAGELPSLKIGTRRLIPAATLDEFVRSRTEGGRNEAP